LPYDDAGHIKYACSYAEKLGQFTALWKIVGEWTPAMTDCAKYLNGRGSGARYDGTISKGAQSYGNCAVKTGKGFSFTQDYQNFLRQSWEAQVS
jgi:glucan 1,3-beta-glucosidase